MKTIFFASLFFPVIASAQLSAGLGLGVNHCNTNSDQIPDDFKSAYARTSLCPQLNVSYDVKRISFSFNESYFVWGIKQDLQFTDASGNDLGGGTLKTNCYSLLSNLAVGYSIGNKFKVTPSATIGMLSVFNQKYKLNGPDFSINNVDIEDVDVNYSNNTIWMAGGQLTFSYELSDRITLFNQDSYQRSLTEVLTPEFDNLNSSLNNFQFFAGVSYILFSHK